MIYVYSIGHLFKGEKKSVGQLTEAFPTQGDLLISPEINKDLEIIILPLIIHSLQLFFC